MTKNKSILEKLGLVETVENNVHAVDEYPVEESSAAPATTPATRARAVPQPAGKYQLREADYEKPADEITLDSLDEHLELDKLLKIDQIYKKFDLADELKNNVHIVDRFLKALPENLPTDVKRHSVHNIIMASGMNLNTLMEDGNRRLNLLDAILDHYTRHTVSIIEENEASVARLQEQIRHHQAMIDRRKKLQEEQKQILQYEIQKIEAIIEFVKLFQ